MSTQIVYVVVKQDELFDQIECAFSNEQKAIEHRDKLKDAKPHYGYFVERTVLQID